MVQKFALLARPLGPPWHVTGSHNQRVLPMEPPVDEASRRKQATEEGDMGGIRRRWRV